MNITIGGRGSGRTTELIKACAADKGSVIVCPTHHQKLYIMDMAKRLGLDIPEPILFSAFCRGNPYSGRRPTGYYIDNLDMALLGCADGIPIRDVAIEGEPADILWLDHSII